MTNYLHDTPLADIPVADAAEQHHPRRRLRWPRPRCPADLLQRDANPSDVIDQAIVVPLRDDDHDTTITAF